MKLTELLCAAFLLTVFSGLAAAFVRPTLALKSSTDRAERALNRDKFIAGSFSRLCEKKPSPKEISDWLLLCRKTYSLESIRVVRTPGSADGRALWKVEWDGLKSLAVAEDA